MTKMDTFSAEECRQFAVQLTQVSSELKRIAREFRFTNQTDFDRIITLQMSILSSAQTMIAQAIDLTVSDPDIIDASARIEKSTENVKKALEKINDIRQILAIATAVLNLVTSVITGFGTGVLPGLSSSLSAIENLLAVIDG